MREQVFAGVVTAGVGGERKRLRRIERLGEELEEKVGLDLKDCEIHLCNVKEDRRCVWALTEKKVE